MDCCSFYFIFLYYCGEKKCPFIIKVRGTKIKIIYFQNLINKGRIGRKDFCKWSLWGLYGTISAAGCTCMNLYYSKHKKKQKKKKKKKNPTRKEAGIELKFYDHVLKPHKWCDFQPPLSCVLSWKTFISYVCEPHA